MSMLHQQEAAELQSREVLEKAGAAQRELNRKTSSVVNSSMADPGIRIQSVL